MTQNSAPESPVRAAADDAPDAGTPAQAAAGAPTINGETAATPTAAAPLTSTTDSGDAWAAFKSTAPGDAARPTAATPGVSAPAASEKDAPEADPPKGDGAATDSAAIPLAGPAAPAPDVSAPAHGASTAAAAGTAGAAPTAEPADADAATEAAAGQDAPLTLTPPSGNAAEKQGPAQGQPQGQTQGQAKSTADGSAAAPADGLFNALSRLGPLAPLLLLLALAWPALLGNGLYCPRETAAILAFQGGLQQNLWLAAGAGSGLWPGYFWYLGGLHALMESAAPQWLAVFFPVAALLGALLPLLAVWVLARAAGLDRREALAGCLLLLAAPIFVPAAYFVGPESLAAALTLFSLACLCGGWQRPQAWLRLPLGFVLAALAGLTGGLFHVLLPLLTSFAFLPWRSGGFARARRLDGVVGFALLLLTLTLWLGALMLGGQPEGYLSGLGGQLWLRPDPARWWLPWLLAGLGLLPWLGVLLCVSWTRVLRTAARDAAASRRERAGVAFLWIACLLAALLGLAMPHPAAAAFCLACLAAPLLGKAMLRLSSTGGQIFRWLAAVLLLLAGLTLAALSFSFSLNWLAGLLPFTLAPELAAALTGLTALPILGGLCLLAAVLLARPVRAGMGNTLLLGACLAVVLTLGAALLLGPRLDALPQAKLKTLDALTAPPPALPVPAAPGATTPGTAAPETSAPSAPAAPEASTPTPAPETAAPEMSAPSAPAGAASGVAPEATAPPAIKSPETPMPQTPAIPADPAPAAPPSPSENPAPDPAPALPATSL